jgi:thymidine kinase
MSRHREPPRLVFFYGPMNCGKSTLALQLHHNHSQRGRHGLLITRCDRSGTSRISSRVGLSADALEVDEHSDIPPMVSARGPDYVICDEVQFYSEEQVEQLVDVVEEMDVDVYAFGLLTDFTSHLFPASRRLLELADSTVRIQVETPCWCGRPGFLNARVVDGLIVRQGPQILIGDTGSHRVRYEVLCRRHYRAGHISTEPAQR